MPVLLGGFAAASLSCHGEPPPALHVSPILHATPESWREPWKRGPYGVEVLHYGSGFDARRSRYRASVDAVTPVVDLSDDVSFDAPRRLYWGIDPRTIPLNARVHMPRSADDGNDGGDGGERFPLVIMAHGMTSMMVDSELGYDYLGRHLASRGYIFASVDMNFLNHFGFGPPTGSMEGRVQLFLRHLEAWIALDATPGPFFEKVDLSRVVFAGHSRGGEAAQVAALFNEWEHYFAWHFRVPAPAARVRSVVAFAPTDGRYPWEHGIEANGVIDYLVVHGSHDGDVTAFEGLITFLRTRLNARDLVKAAVFVHHANHGQWNALWGIKDHGLSSRRDLRISALMSGEKQRAIGATLMAAFLDGTVGERRENLRVFWDRATAEAWLPETGLVTQFQSSRFQDLASFAGDEDRETGSMDGVTLRVLGADEWTEQVLPFRARGWRDQHNRVMRITWQGDARVDVAIAPGVLTDVLADMPADASLHMAMVPTAQVEPGTWRVEVEDGAGQVASVPLNRSMIPRPPLEVQVFRDPEQEATFFERPADLLLQSVIIPMESFVAANQHFSPAALQRVSLVLTSSRPQTLYLDRVGILL